MKDVLMWYRKVATIKEFEVTLNKYKDDNIVFVAENDIHRNLCRLDFPESDTFRIITIKEEMEGILGDMIFDYIVGNPPFNDKSDNTDAGNLYIDITKRCLNLLKYSGEIKFITPRTIAQPKKGGFSLSGLKGLKSIDYTADEKFNVGVKILEWHYINNSSGDVTIINDDYTKEIRNYKESMVQQKDILAFALFEKIKATETRMFINVQTGQKKSSKESDVFKYKIVVNAHRGKIEYSSVLPRLHKKNKIIISLSRDISTDNMIISKEDHLGVVTDISEMSTEQIENLKDFLLSDMVSRITKKYKIVYNTGFTNILRFFPIIDVTKKYSEDDIISFFELTEEEVQWLKN